MRRRVAVTGWGIITAHGAGADVNMQAFMEGRDSIREISSFDVSAYTVKNGGEAAGFEFSAPLRHLKRKRLDKSTFLLLAAFEEALGCAGLEKIAGDCVVSLGTTLGGMLTGQAYHKEGLTRGFDRARPAALVDYLAHSQAIGLMKEYEITGEALTFSDACASGTNSIGHGFHKVRSGEADVAVAGGYDTMCEFTFAGFNSLQAVTRSLCRPFDRKRDGLVLGEGAGVLILEDLERALARKAAVLGEVVGYGASSDAYHSTRPDPEAKGAVSSIRAALDDAGADPGEIDYINAHGTGTPYNDLMEATAINEVFGGRPVPVSSIKPMIGHLLGASGAVEAIVALMAIKWGFLPPNINCEDPDPECGIELARDPCQRSVLKKALSNSFGFGGANATLIFQGYRD